MSITQKLVLAFILVLTVVIASVSGLAIYQARETAEQGARQASLRQMEQVDYAISQFFETMRREAAFLASDERLSEAVGQLPSYVKADQSRYMDPEKSGGIEAELFQTFKRFAQAKGGLAYVYFGNRNGEYVQWPKGESGARYDPRARPWYKAAKRAGEGGTMTDAYYFEPDDATIVSVTHEVRDTQGDFVGAMGLDVSLKGLMDLVKSIEIGDSGHLLLIEDTGTILANPLDPETNFKKVQDLNDPSLAKLQSMDQGSQTITIDNTPYQATVFTSPDLDWTFIGLVPRAEMMAQANRLAWQIGGIGLIFLVLSAGVALMVARLITRPIRNVAARMGDIAAGEGDLTQRLPEDSSDEIGELSSQFNAFVATMHSTIQEVEGTTQSLASAAEELNTVASQTRQSVERQGSETDQIATAINEMTATVQEVSRNGNEVADAASEADKEAREGGAIVAENARTMDTLGDELDQMASVIGQLSDRSQEIKTVLDVIHSVTEQTSLLALNAAIEAARAGEYGRGFAVVADEVRGLAQRSSSSAEEIQTIINGLISDTGQAVDQMRQAKEQSNENRDRAAEAKSSLESIENAVSRIREQVTQIATAAEEQTHVAEEINKNVTGIVEAAQESSAGTEQTNRASDEVARMAERLREVVGRFRI